MADPEAGRSISGSGLLRKIRFGEEGRGKGKRGGVRVIYVFTPDAFRIDLVTVYGKEEKDDLTADEVKELCSLARLLRDEAKAAFDRSVRSAARQGVQRRKERS